MTSGRRTHDMSLLVRPAVAVLGMTALLVTTVVGMSGQSPDLASVASSMPPGAWTTVPTVNATQVLAQTGASSGHILGFAENLVWTPRTRELYFMGGDHGDL